jgi:hypothetical protein
MTHPRLPSSLADPRVASTIPVTLEPITRWPARAVGFPGTSSRLLQKARSGVSRQVRRLFNVRSA